ncbi:hypothetical protein [Hymenobacter sp. DG25A]|uniref:TapB family protein n=1 Tax=Hymenobacter sp. DG25A TaxID=1385663 RepID=UPI0006BE0E4D|nr:hypothetical protein [Hymenobacter sp. DG25A]ALD20991.1 hypothetical protein AM218_06820 [Hymenobacter sp. DG25A]
MHRTFSFLSWHLLPFMALAACSRPVTSARPEVVTPAANTAATPPTSAAAPTPNAPDCAHPFGLYDKMELIYKLADTNGKPQGEIRNRVVMLETKTDKKSELKINTVLLKSGFYGPDNQLIRQQDLTFHCQRDTAFTDGMQEMDYNNLKSFRDRYFEYTPTSLAWPHQAQAGSSLPQGGILVDVHSSAVDIAKVYTTVRNRRVVGGPQNITTPAGTFRCYKVESERESAIKPKPDIIRRTITYAVDYYSPTVGIVRTEVYDKSHKLQQTQVLASRQLR